LGSVLYQMVSGRPPFRAPSALAVLKRVAEETPRPIREIIPETPQWLCEIITKLHAKNPDERYQSAREIADVLANCESQLKSHSGLKDFSLIPQAKRPHPGWQKSASKAMLVLPLLALGLYIFNRSSEQNQRAETNMSRTLTTDRADSSADAMPEIDGWISLFNGKDLTGWESHPDQFGNWHVEEGLLTGSERPSYLFSQRDDFTNFHVRCEARINAGGDGGILARAPFEKPTRNGLPGYEAQLQAGSPLVNGWQTGAIGSSDAVGGWNLLQTSGASIAPDTWVTLEVIAVGNRIETRLGGQTIAVHTDPLQQFKSGRLALRQSGGSTRVQFRKIEVRPVQVPSGAPSPEAETLPR